MFIIFSWLFYVAYAHNFNMDYYMCGAEQFKNCTNPFYKPISWVNQEFLPVGEYGIKPGPLFNSVYWVPFLFLGLAVVINHLKYNKGKFNLNTEEFN